MQLNYLEHLQQQQTSSVWCGKKVCNVYKFWLQTGIGCLTVADIKNRKDIQLRNVPLSATPADIQRLVKKTRMEDVTAGENFHQRILERHLTWDAVQLDYHRFLPTGRAYVSISHPNHLEQALRSLEKASLSAHPLFYSPAPPISHPVLVRSRGADGRAKAAERGLFEGNGPSAGIKAKGVDVVLYGLPGKLMASALKSYLLSVKLVELKKDGEADCETFRIDLCVVKSHNINEADVKFVGPRKSFLSFLGISWKCLRSLRHTR